MNERRTGGAVRASTRSGHRARAAEGGFTLIEVMVATVVVMLAALALAGVLTGALAAVSRSQQNQQASDLASSVLAEAEALPWATLSSGLSTGAADPYYSTDANIGGGCFEGLPLVIAGSAVGVCPSASVQGGSAYPWQDVSGPACGSSLAAVISGSSTAPLVPHQSCVTLNGTKFEVVVYASLSSGSTVSATGAQITVTAVVTWGSGTSDGTGRDRVTDTEVFTNCAGSAVRCS